LAGDKEDTLAYDVRKRNEVFMKDGVPYWFAGAGYLILAVISIITVPFIVSAVKWYYVVVAYLVGPVFAFSNAYGCGLTDWSLASNYGKILLFIFATWAGPQGGILAGLAACGIAMTIVQSAADLMQDFKTGYLTLSSPRSMFTAQVIGALMGVIIALSTFWLYYKAFHVGAPGSIYQAPFAVIYRTMALIGVEGFGSLPKHCLQLCAGWFAFAIVVNFIRDKVPKKYAVFIPIPMAMAIPFYLGAYFAIDMFIGTVIRAVWQLTNRKKADTFSPAVAAGLICGDGLWTVPSAILVFAKVNPPLCMTFFPSKVATAMGFPLYTQP
jgi:OPT family oligopeptide transporter